MIRAWRLVFHASAGSLLLFISLSCAGEPLSAPGWNEAPPEVLSATSLRGPVRAGAARVSINPPYSSPMAGYFGASWLELHSLRDPLFARAAVLEKGDFRLGLVSIDRVLIPPSLRKAVEAREAFRRSGVKEWIVGATHTHTAPGSYVEAWPAALFGTGAYDPLLFDHLADRIALALESAASLLRDVKVESAAGRLEGSNPISFNRRDPLLSADPTFDMVRFSGSLPVARLFRFAAHPTVVPFYLRRASAEYPGVLCRALEEQDGGITLFLQGASADLAAGAREDTPVVGWERRMERFGRRLAAEASRLEENMVAATLLTEAASDFPFVHLRAQVVLPPRLPWRLPFVGREIASHYPPSALVQCVRLGDLLIVTFPGEMSSGLAETILSRIKTETGANQALLWTLTDDYLGYAFSRDVYEKGGMSQHLVAYGKELGDHIEKQLASLAMECWKRGALEK